MLHLNRSRLQLVALLFGAWGLSFAAYSPSLRASFTSDDYGMLLPAQQSTSLWAAFAQTRDVRYYRPIQEILITIILRLCGDHPLPFRVVGMVLHGINIALVFWVGTRSLSLFPATAGMSSRIAATGAALFAVLPRMNESVGWIAAHNALIVTLFLLVATGAMLEYYRDHRVGWLLLMGAALVLGFCSRESMISFPFIAVAYGVVVGTNDKVPRPAWKRVLITFRQPAVWISMVLGVMYIGMRVALFPNVFGAGTQAVHFELWPLLQMAAFNLLRYPIMTFLVPQVVFTMLGPALGVLFELFMIALAGCIVYGGLWKWFDASPGISGPKLIGRLRSVVLFHMLVFWMAMVSTIHLSLSITENGGGRYAYSPAAWGVMIAGIVLWCIQGPRIRTSVITMIIGVYAAMTWHSSFGFRSAGDLTDQQITDYVECCRAHVDHIPTVLSTYASIGGFAALGEGGLRNAVLFNNLRIPVPHEPWFTIGIGDRHDSIEIHRRDSATIAVKVCSPRGRVTTVLENSNRGDSESVIAFDEKFSSVKSTALHPTGQIFLAARHGRLLPWIDDAGENGH